MSMASSRHLIAGPVGAIEVAVDTPDTIRGLALIAHPHPLFGGTPDNKVATTLSRALRELGYVALRPSFRGVGKTEGTHDHGMGETDDLLAVLAWGKAEFGDLPVALAGFSFGAFVQTRVAAALAQASTPASKLVLVGTAAGHVTGARSYTAEPVANDALIIHGELDETVPLINVRDWARPQGLPVVVVPGADHFFHGKLQIIRSLLTRAFGSGA